MPELIEYRGGEYYLSSSSAAIWCHFVGPPLLSLAPVGTGANQLAQWMLVYAEKSAASGTFFVDLSDYLREPSDYEAFRKACIEACASVRRMGDIIPVAVQEGWKLGGENSGFAYSGPLRTDRILEIILRVWAMVDPLEARETGRTETGRGSNR